MKDDVGEAVKGDERYGFSKIKGQEFAQWADYYKWIKEPVTEINMTLHDETEWFYNFKLDKKHRGHSIYKGCSGAPITEASGQLCSVVVGGDDKKHTIRGLKFKKFLNEIDYKVK
jgi:hypothetical protein